MEMTTKLFGFRSMCPKCAEMRPQRGYDRNSLLRLLNGGYPVEAYCVACEEYWPISVKERAALGAAAIEEPVSASTLISRVQGRSKTQPCAGLSKLTRGGMRPSR